jgi:hypothetical protein
MYVSIQVSEIFVLTVCLKSHDSSVGIALGYGLDDWGSRVRFPVRAGNFSLHHRVQTGSGALPVSYTMGTRGSFPGDKAAGAWSWPLTSIYCRGQRMNGAIHPLLQYAFMSWCSVEAQGQLYLYLLLFVWSLLILSFICSLSLPESSIVLTSFTRTIVPIYLAWILQPLECSLLPLIWQF